MGKYSYSDSEQETLKVLKMQEMQLKNLEDGIAADVNNGQKDANDLADIRKRAEALLRKRGIIPPPNKKAKPIDTTIHKVICPQCKQMFTPTQSIANLLDANHIVCPHCHYKMTPMEAKKTQSKTTWDLIRELFNI